MTPGLEASAHRVLAALGNGLYQGAILALLVALALRALRQANAATRYGVELTALTAIALLPLLHLVFPGKVPPASVHQAIPSLAAGDFGSERTDEDAALLAGIDAVSVRNAAALQEPPGEGTEPATGRPEPPIRLDRFVAAEQVRKEQAVLNEPLPERGLHSAGSHAGAGTSLRAEARAPHGFRAAERAHEAQVAPREPATGRAGTPLPVEPVRGPNGSPFIPRWEFNLPVWVTFPLLGAWLLLAGARLARLAWQYGVLWRLRRHSIAPAAALSRLMTSLARECGLRRQVELRLCDEVASPLAIGFRPPAILLPTRLAEASPADLESMLRHELAHVQRRDDWSNLLQRLIEALLAFHPAVWWLSHRLTLDREIACDDHVLAAARSPRDYALLLTDFAARMPGRFLPAAPAAWSRNSQLKQRIRMLLDPHRNTSIAPARSRTVVLGAAWVALAVAGFQLGPRLALGGVDSPAADAAPAVEARRDATPAALAEVSTDPLRSPDPKPKATIAPTPSVNVVIAPTPAAVALHSSPQPQPAPVPVVIADLAAPAVSAVVAVPATLAVTQPPPPPPAPRHPAPVPHAESGADEWAKPAGPARLRGDSVEARLERLERQLERLLEQRDAAGGPPRGRVEGKDPFFAEQERRAAKMREEAKARAQEMKAEAQKMKEKAKSDRPQPKDDRQRELFGYGAFPDAEQVKQQVSRILEQVAGQVEQATREAERAVLEAQRSARLAQQGLRGAREGREVSLEQHRRALEQERKSLQNRIEAIEGQLERLEEQLDRVDEQFERLDEDIERMENEAKDEAVDHEHPEDSDQDHAAPEPKPAREENSGSR